MAGSDNCFYTCLLYICLSVPTLKLQRNKTDSHWGSCCGLVKTRIIDDSSLVLKLRDHDYFLAGDKRMDFPLGIYGVAGMQVGANNIVTFKIFNLHQIKKPNDDKEEESDEDDETGGRIPRKTTQVESGLHQAQRSNQ